MASESVCREALLDCAEGVPVVRWTLTLASYESRGGAGWCESYVRGRRLSEQRRRGGQCQESQ